MATKTVTALVKCVEPGVIDMQQEISAHIDKAKQNLHCSVCYYDFEEHGEHAPQILIPCCHRVDLVCARQLFGSIINGSVSIPNKECPTCRAKIILYVKDCLVASLADPVAKINKMQPAFKDKCFHMLEICKRLEDIAHKLRQRKVKQVVKDTGEKKT